MTATLIDISDQNLQLPEWLVIDASLLLVLAATVSNPIDPRTTTAKKFLQRISRESKAGNIYLLLPLLALEECYFKIIQTHLSNLVKGTTIKWHVYYKQHPQSIQTILPILTKFKLILDAFPISVIEPEDLALSSQNGVKSLSERMLEMIKNFSVLPKDATILSDAERLGIYSVASLDKDWERATGFKVYTII